tara:strand:- start:91 stop:1314 length:1224 start_codon:yes stop_codon:yes gene_type:complete
MNTILLSNLIIIRWIAIFGQFITIIFVNFILEINLPLISCLLIVLLSVFVNLFSYIIQKRKNKISDKEVFFYLFFDTSQLIFLLYLTGGIFNPFSILIVAPIIISASYLAGFWTVILSFFSIILLVFIYYNFVPLNFNQIFFYDDLYKYGVILSIIVTIIFIAVYSYIFASSSRKISKALSDTKLLLSNQKKITEVGSLSAAAVHELSTPLNTVFLILNDLLKNKNIIKDLSILEDIKLLKSQAERCKEILLRLSKNQLKLKDNFFEKIKITNLIEICFDKFNDGKKLEIINLIDKEIPEITFKDEIMYSVGNIIQNSIIYAKKYVFVTLNNDKEFLILKIEDDGRGFAKELMDKFGEPYISKNSNGMGLGIFIAKNLIENMDGKISFFNSLKGGATVEIKLKKDIL